MLNKVTKYLVIVTKMQYILHFSIHLLLQLSLHLNKKTLYLTNNCDNILIVSLIKHKYYFFLNTYFIRLLRSALVNR